MNVELHDAAGEKLNLAAGKTAQLTFPVSSSQVSNAPATIPTWHFDTNSGLWMEEGSAVKNGNGLSNMQKRAATHKGTFTIHSATDEGTEIVVSFPV